MLTEIDASDNSNSTNFNVVVGVVTSVDDVVNESIKFYPNPATNIVFVNSGYEIESRQVALINALVDIVRRQQLVTGKNALDISDLPKGLYFYQLLVEEKVVDFGKLIRQ